MDFTMQPNQKPIELLKIELSRHETILEGIFEELKDTPSVNMASVWRRKKLETEAMIRLYKHSIKKLKK